MIYTITANPALDINVSKTGQIQEAGGKGINISRLLLKHGVKTTALGFIGGETGEIISSKIEKGIKQSFVKIEGESRKNIKILYDEQADYFGKTPKVEEKDVNKFFKKLEKITKDDLVIISGSVPENLNEHFYEEIIRHLTGVEVVVDCRANQLLHTLKYHPELVKPNVNELMELFSVQIKNNKDVKKYAKKLLDYGAKRVMVSLGPKGVLYMSKDTCIIKKLKHKGEIVSTVGAGDALIAGFVLGCLAEMTESQAVDKALELANEVVYEGALLKWDW